MGIWSAVKYALNSTLGTSEFRPLDALIALTNRKNYQIFTADGTFTVPKGVTQIYVTACAGGGGGGGPSRTGGGQRTGAGGAGGDYIVKRPYDVQSGEIIPITVGIGGAGGHGSSTYGSGTAGSSGGSTIIGNLVTLSGGGGGDGGAHGDTNAKGGTPANNGGAGGNGTAYNNSHATTEIKGGIANLAHRFLFDAIMGNIGNVGEYSLGSNGGAGGSSLFDGSDGLRYSTTNINLKPKYGGGGGGSGSNGTSSDSSAYTGGSGGDGVVIIEWGNSVW